MDIPIYYDPMISKLITYGDTREAAIQRMIEAIQLYEIEGVATTLPFGTFVCQHEAFTSGKFDTHFVKNYFTPAALEQQSKEEAAIAAQIGLRLLMENRQQLKSYKIEETAWFKNR
jgi:pyruvate carboxylase subunit A